MILDLREGKLGKSSSDAYSKPGEKGDSFTSIIPQNPPTAHCPGLVQRGAPGAGPSTASWGHRARQKVPSGAGLEALSSHLLHREGLRRL